MGRFEKEVPSHSLFIMMGIIFVIIIAGILFFISYKSYNPINPLDSKFDETYGLGAWDGCRGNGLAVCTDHPNVTDQYFIDHPDCTPNNTCEGIFYACNENLCPKP